MRNELFRLMFTQSSLKWERTITDGGLRSAERFYCRFTDLFAFLLLFLASILVWRRAAGAIHSPLSLGGLFAAGIFLSGIAAAVHGGRRFFARHLEGIRLAEVVLSLALLGIALTLSLPGSSPVGLVVFWLLLFLEEFWAWTPRFVRLSRRDAPEVFASEPLSDDPSEFSVGTQTFGATSSVIPASNSPIDSLVSSSARFSGSLSEETELSESLPPEEVSQQLTRTFLPDGTEELSGWLRMPLAVGQRTGNVHVAFCPPFARLPVLLVEQLDGPEARIKTAQVLPYGARLDVKLHTTNDTSSSILLHFSARVEGESEKNSSR